MTVRVLLADDQELVRAGFEMIIDAADDLEVVGNASDGSQAIQLTRSVRPGRRLDGYPDALARRD